MVDVRDQPTDVTAQAAAEADEVKERVQDATDAAKGRAGSLADDVRANPVPFAVGALLALIVLNRFRKRRRARRRERSLL